MGLKFILKRFSSIFVNQHIYPKARHFTTANKAIWLQQAAILVSDSLIIDKVQKI